MDRAALETFIGEATELATYLRTRGKASTEAVPFVSWELFEPVEGKALVHAPSTQQGQRGKLIVQGKVADFDWDRQDEMFEPGAFDAGLEEFKKNPIMVFSHAKQVMDTVNGPSNYVQIGKWDPDSFEKKTDGLYARGEMRGASVGGKFYKHRSGDGKVRISKVDLQEISIAPKPVNARTLLNVVQAAT